MGLAIDRLYSQWWAERVVGLAAAVVAFAQGGPSVA
jgi:hypothetical protein